MSAWEWTPEWLPRKEAAEVSGYHVKALDLIIRKGAVPTRKGIRPGTVAVETTFLHLPSLVAYRAERARRRAGVPRPDQMQRSVTKLGSALQGWRVAKGWTQKDVAKAVGTTHEIVSLWEIGKRAPSVRLVVKLCELYDLSYQERWAVIEAIAWRQEQQ